MGYAATTCQGAEEALEQTAECRFDVILCDIFMPGSDGVTLLRSLRKQGDQTPFILMSGVADPVKPIEGIENGALCFITKPVTADLLESTLARLLD
jgi:two-component system nitrogen regulation response regulator NtrX